MLYYFPTLLPDEKLSHGWARYVERSAYSNVDLAFWDLFAPHKRAHGHHRFEKFETHIDAFVSNLPPDFPYTSDYLIDNHTLYPLYSFTLPKKRALEARSVMKGHRRTPRGGPSIIKPYNWSHQFARYCIECAKEDILSYGETYWHRLHQIPDIYVCSDHYCWLENTGLKLNDKDLIGHVTAGRQIDISRQPKYFSQDEDFEKIQLFLARSAKYFLSINPSCKLYLEDMQERYRSRLFEMGFSNIIGNVYKGKVRNYIGSQIKPHLLQQLQEVLYGFKQIWNTSLVPDCTIAPPTIHFLSMYFLDIEPKFFVELSTAINPFGPGPWPCINPGCRNFNKQVIYTWRRLYYAGKDFGVFSCNCGSSYKVEFKDNQKNGSPVFFPVNKSH